MASKKLKLADNLGEDVGLMSDDLIQMNQIGLLSRLSKICRIYLKALFFFFLLKHFRDIFVKRDISRVRMRGMVWECGLQENSV